MRVGIDRILSDMGSMIRDNTINHRQQQLQRRNGLVDMYGVPFYSEGDATHVAEIPISISKDLIFLERFEFKLNVKPFYMPLATNGATNSVVVGVNNTTLSTSNGNTTLTATNNPDTNVVTINPNPHTHSSTITPSSHSHTTNAHNHSVSPGVSLITSSFSDMRVILWDNDYQNMIDLTDYLKLQYPDWITAEGTFPPGELDNFDLLEVAGLLPAWQREILTSSGYKRIQFIGDGIFRVELLLYLKYSHVNR